MKTMIWLPALIACALAVAAPSHAETAPAGPGAQGDCLRVGVFDSRAVAIVFLRSPAGREPMFELKRRHAEAKEAGNDSLMADLEAQGLAMQDRWHRMGFGTASVRWILRRIEDRLPELAREAGVDLIVSRWNVVFQEPDVQLVDVTAVLVDALDTDEDIPTLLSELAKNPPLTEEELDHLDPHE